MYDELIKQLRDNAEFLVKASSGCLSNSFADTMWQSADAIEELQTTLCNWCAVCPEDKRDLSTCEIYESCRAKPPKEVKDGEQDKPAP